jgi:hypothetical protein
MELTELLAEVLKQYAIEEGFSLFGQYFKTVSLLYVYAVAALICLIYVVITMIAGGIADWFSIDDDGVFPATAIGLGVFATVGGLSLFFFKATPSQSVLYGFAGGVAVALCVVFALNWLARNQSNMIVQATDLDGRTGTCSLRIRPGLPGQIEVSIGGVRRYLTAYAKEGVEVGQRVRIKTVRNSNEVDIEKLEETQ